MFRIVCLLIAVLGLAQSAAAQQYPYPSMFEPNNTWGGRIRYARGPFGGERYHRHWRGQFSGNIVNGLTTVFTNENFLNAVNDAVKALRDAEPAAPPKPIDPELIALVDKIDRQNDELLSGLNDVRTLMGMKLIPAFPPSPARLTSTPALAGATPKLTVEQVNAINTDIKQRRTLLATEIQQALKFKDATAFGKLSSMQQARFGRIETLSRTPVATVSNLPALGAVSLTPTEFDRIASGIDQQVRALETILADKIAKEDEFLKSNKNPDLEADREAAKKPLADLNAFKL